MTTTPVTSVRVSAYTVPTARPESDGTFEWASTTAVVVEAFAGGECGLGYTYADAATAKLVEGVLADVVKGTDPMAVPAAWAAMVHAIRNLGRPGLASMAIAAVDTALWDLKARLLGLPLVTLLGGVRDSVEVYGSGGFTSYSTEELHDELSSWAASGMRMVKMKVGRDPASDVERACVARRAIGPDCDLFVDANGAYTTKEALLLAEGFAREGVRWFEEPVTSDDLEGMRLVRDRAPAGMDIAAGEYGYDLPYFGRMLEAGAVDVLQADATRCGGITGFLRVSALCEARSLPLSAHCAPALHLHAGCALSPLVHLEWFADHARLESLLFEGARQPVDGRLAPDLDRAGMGLELNSADAARYRTWGTCP